jgi:hypothetical protein
MVNRVALNAQHMIEQHYDGDQSEASLRKMVERSSVLIKRLRHAGRPVYILVDIAKLGHLPVAVRKVAVKSLMHTEYDRIAVYNPTTFAKVLIRLIARAAGKSRLVRVFKTRAEAVAWLEKYARQENK